MLALASSRAPIVLVRKRGTGDPLARRLAGGVAPGLDRVGAMLTGLVRREGRRLAGRRGAR